MPWLEASSGFLVVHKPQASFNWYPAGHFGPWGEESVKSSCPFERTQRICRWTHMTRPFSKVLFEYTCVLLHCWCCTALRNNCYIRSIIMSVSLVFQSKQRAREKQLKNRTWKALLHNPVGHYKHILPLKGANCSSFFFTLTVFE